MANGTHALKLLASEPPSEPPATPSAEIETTIGAVVANAVTAFCVSMQSYQHFGHLDPELREAGGNRMAQLVEMWLAHEGSDEDFIDMAHRAGRAQLRRFLDAEYFRRYTAVHGDAALDFFLDSVFEIAHTVTRQERVFRAAWAN